MSSVYESLQVPNVEAIQHTPGPYSHGNLTFENQQLTPHLDLTGGVLKIKFIDTTSMFYIDLLSNQTNSLLSSGVELLIQYTCLKYGFKNVSSRGYRRGGTVSQELHGVLVQILYDVWRAIVEILKTYGEDAHRFSVWSVNSFGYCSNAYNVDYETWITYIATGAISRTSEHGLVFEEPYKFKV